MKEKRLILMLLLALNLSGCGSVHHDLTAPCPNYGKHCQKTPLNPYPAYQPGDLPCEKP